LLAEAFLDAVAEGQMSGGMAVQVEGVGVGELLSVTVRGLDREGDRLAGP
jgi:hypothetical protein